MRTFCIYPLARIDEKHADLYWEVRVFASYKALRSWARKECKRSGDKTGWDRAQAAVMPRTRINSERDGTEKTLPSLGFMVFRRGVFQSIVSHESVHAALDTMRRLKKSCDFHPDRRHTSNEELLCRIAGEIARMVVNGLCGRDKECR